jgi:hypothetical protein
MPGLLFERRAMATKAKRRRPEERLGYEAGYAWAESGRSLNDLEVVMDYCTLEFPEEVTDEILAKEETIYVKMHDEVFEEGELDALEQQSDDYQAGWWDGVTAFYVKEITPAR